MKPDEFTSLKRTKAYINELKEWANDIESYSFGDPDTRDFPQNNKGDILLILRTNIFYTPSHNPLIKNNIFRKKIKTPKSLELTIAKVIGDSEIDYHDPWERDLKLKCSDGKERYVDAVDNAGRDFIFLPHPDLFFKFHPLIQFLPGFHYINGNIKKVNIISNVTDTLFRMYEKGKYNPKIL